MSDFIINPKSTSFSEIRGDLSTYLNSKPDIAQWSLFLQSNAGSNLIDVVAGIGAFMKMEAIVNRREGFIQFAQNRSSIVGHSQGLGYSAYRGRNKVIKITIVPEVTEVIPRYTYVGTVRDRYLITESDVVATAGTPVTFNVIVGEVFSESKLAPSTNLNVFRFKTSGVSEDCIIFIDDNEMETTESVEGMLSGKFFLQTNPYGSLDAKYLNLGTFIKRYITGSSITLTWISLKDVDFDDTEVKLYEEYGILTGLSTVSVFEDVEDSLSISIRAPLHNETGYSVRGREDQVKIFKTLHPDIIDAKGIDVSSAIMKIFLLRKDGIAFTPQEKIALQEVFEPKRPHGLLPPIIEDADASPITLNAVITLKRNSTTLSQVLLDGILANYRNKLGVTINLPDIESALEEDAGVKIARVSIAANPWVANSQYRLGQYSKKTPDNGLIYRVTKLNNKSGLTEPVWPTEDKLTVNDFEIVWKAVPKSDLAGFSAWTATTMYNLGAQIKPSVVNGFVYECVDVRFHSGEVEPAWPADDMTETFDGSLIWISRPVEGIVSVWTANTAYKKGDVVVASNGEIVLMHQCIGYVGSSGNVTPAFPTTLENVVEDYEVVWQAQNPTQNDHIAAKNQFYVITSNLTVV